MTTGSTCSKTQHARTVAGLLLDRLVAAGVRHVFGVPGDYNLQLLDVIAAHPELEWVGAANELNAAYAADGYARITGLGVLVTTYGVGELSAINGMAGSFAEHVPVLQIVGAPKTAVQRDGLPVHHSFLDGDPAHFVRVHREVTCASSQLTAGNAVAEIDRVLDHVLLEKQPGYLSLPSDLVNMALPMPLPEWEIPGPEALACAADGETRRRFEERVTELVGGARRVVVLADHLADRHRVRREVNALIKAGNLISATTTAGKSVIDETAPGFLGLYLGAPSEPHVREAVEEADAIVAVGLRLDDLSSGGFTVRLDPAKLVDLQPAHAVVGGVRFPGTTMPTALRVITSVVRGRDAERPGIAETDAPGDGRCPVARSADPPLSQMTFWQRLGEFLRPGDLISADQGTAFYGVLGVRLPARAEVIAQPLWASIGYSLPAIIGAQLAAVPRRRAVLLIGDGALQMTVQEIGTIVRHGLDPIVFVLNNDGYSVERAIRGRGACYNDIARWNVGDLPAAFGAPEGTVVRRVTDLGELDEALAACSRAAGRLSFVDVVLERDDLPAVLSEVAKGIAAEND
jgi:indolepyruvate decarboxylase